MAGEAKKAYRVWVSGRKETTTETISAASSLYARIAKAGRHGVKSTDCVAQRVSSAVATGAA